MAAPTARRGRRSGRGDVRRGAVLETIERLPEPDLDLTPDDLRVQRTQ